jgi:restriction endonuclease Mrr
MNKLHPHLVELVYDTLLKSYWRKDALKAFLRRMSVSASALSQLETTDTKRVWLDRLFPLLEATPTGQSIILDIAKALCRQTTFPDLMKWEDAVQKIEEASRAVEILKSYMNLQDEASEREQEQNERRKRSAAEQSKAVRALTDLANLKCRLESLTSQLGTQQAGYDFQKWLYDLLDYEDIDNRRPYVAGGRQIDGSLTLDGTTYLVEAKYTGDQSSAPDIDSLKSKVDSKADNTMGVFISISGYSSVAKDVASSAKSPLLLLDHNHLYMVLNGISTMKEVIQRVRRHSSQTGRAYLPVAEFGG